MKTPICLFLLVASACGASAASLMLDFGATAVASPYLTLSPGHASGDLTGSDTTWNTISSSASSSSLKYSDDSVATGITLTLGQEATVGNNTLSYSTSITNLALAGTGGGTGGQKSLLGAGSIFGNDTSSTAAGRDGFFGGGSSGAGAAIGLRLDGLAAGDYVIYLMGRNTNTNAGPPAVLTTNFYVTTGASSGSFDFSSLSPEVASNPSYASATYAGEYNTFTEGETFVAMNVTLGSGESLFLAADGTGSDTRGFLNMVQVVSVPEPSAACLACAAGLVLIRRRRH